MPILFYRILLKISQWPGPLGILHNGALFSTHFLCKMPSCFFLKICYNNNCQEGMGLDSFEINLSALKKSRKKIKKPLDKQHSVCYNIIVPKGNTKN